MNPRVGVVTWFVEKGMYHTQMNRINTFVTYNPILLNIK